MSRTYIVRTYGCQMNEHDSERISGLLEADGLVRVESEADADVVVLNTCCIRENADNKLYGNLGHLKTWKAEREGRQIVVSGCLAQKDQELVAKRAGHVDVVMGTHNVHRAAVLLAESRTSDRPITEILTEAVIDDQALFPSALPARRFQQEELDQMLAPIALYPDSLLGQILVAATYPDQVTEADQWVRQNSNLQGDELNAALDGMDWDLSVKALVPFPQVLSMMSDKMDWTQRMGDAFLAQQEDVMDTIQRLRAKAHAQGNLKSTDQQKVVVRGESIEIEPANPRVVYVPTYNPTVIYGSWWYPAYPPYAYNPYYPHYAYDPYYTGVGFVTAGLFGFAAGIAVGSVWNSGWGHWDWGRHNVNVNINRTININRNDIRSTRYQDLQLA